MSNKKHTNGTVEMVREIVDLKPRRCKKSDFGITEDYFHKFNLNDIYCMDNYDIVSVKTVFYLFCYLCICIHDYFFFIYIHLYITSLKGTGEQINFPMYKLNSFHVRILLRMEITVNLKK